MPQPSMELLGPRTHDPQNAELDRRTITADCLDADRLLVRIDAGEPVEIGQPSMVIVGVLYSLYRLAGFDPGEFERARPQDVLLVPARVLVEDLLLVDPAKGSASAGKNALVAN